jgi:hypothetical protein
MTDALSKVFNEVKQQLCVKNNPGVAHYIEDRGMEEGSSGKIIIKSLSAIHRR